MIDECDEPADNDWPNDDEANDIMLAYAAAEDKHGSSSGCLWLILIFKAILVAALLVSSSIDSDLSISEALRKVNLLDERDRRSISAAFSGTMDFCKADRQEFHDN